MYGLRIVNIGLIGCGEVAQVVHIPTLLALRSKFRITYLCDVSPSALSHCQSLIPKSPQTTADPAILCSSPDVDVVLIASSDEYHASHAICALENNKHVLVEKPLALTVRDVNAIIAAEEKSKGKVMVGYMRRYASPFADAVKEIGGMDKIIYARVRDIIGQNSVFVGQSGLFPVKFMDFKEGDSTDKTERGEEQVRTALVEECGIDKEKVEEDGKLRTIWRMLGSLGSHDLSVMRECLGMPEKVVGSSLGLPVWNVLFRYPQGFTVSYESGIHHIPQFDAHIEVYSDTKIVRVQYDTPYVKGLPVTLHITEAGDDGQGNSQGALKQTSIRKTYEDPYTLEMKEMWRWVVEGKEVKTTAKDALEDLKIFEMCVRHATGQR